MERVITVCLPVLTLCLGSFLAAAAGSEDMKVASTSEQEGERDFPARWAESNAYVHAPRNVQEAIMTVAKVAKEYDRKTEDDIMALPGIKEVKVHPLGDAVNIKIASPDGQSKEFQYYRKQEHLTFVTLVEPDGSLVGVNYTTPRYNMRPMLGTVKSAKSAQTWLIDFHLNNGRPKSITPTSGGILGLYILWDEEGNVLFQREYTTPKTLFDLGADIRAALGEEKANALGFRPPGDHDILRPLLGNKKEQSGQKPGEGEK